MRRRSDIKARIDKIKGKVGKGSNNGKIRKDKESP